MWVLRFRDGFDLGPVAARFDERGFSTTTVPGATIRSHAMDVSADWLRATAFGILNTAFLDDGRTLVLSVASTRSRTWWPITAAIPPSSGFRRRRASSTAPPSAMLLPGLATCGDFVPMPIDISHPLASPDLSQPPAGLHPYAVLGVGYERPDWDPIGRISFGYLDAATATADLAGRAALARSGESVRAREPYADMAFQVVDGRADGAILTLDVSPFAGQPRRLFDMVYGRDMVFAGC